MNNKIQKAYSQQGYGTRKWGKEPLSVVLFVYIVVIENHKHLHR